MKKIIKLLSILLPFFLLQQNIFAQNDNYKKFKFVKNKSFNKTYNISTSDKLVIDNSFGSVEVHTWAKNEIKIDVSVEASSNTESVAQKTIDGITITDSQSGGGVSVKTSIDGTNNNPKNEKSSMKVNYDISMPAANPLEIVNQFGATIIPDFKGEVDLTSKFGSLTTGNLSNVKSIDVEFGKATIESAANGSVSIKYSSADIGKLVGKVKLDLEFSSNTKINYDNSLTSLTANVSYSTINLRPVGDVSVSYSISTSFGDFKNRSSIKFNSDEDDDDSKGPKFDHNYNGKSGNGSVPVKINSSFGKVILGEASSEDMKSKDKEKNKNKGKEKIST